MQQLKKEGSSVVKDFFTTESKGRAKSVVAKNAITDFILNYRRKLGSSTCAKMHKFKRDDMLIFKCYF